MFSKREPTARIGHGSLRIARVLYDFIRDEVAPGTGIAAAQFWDCMEKLIEEMLPENRRLLQLRQDLQQQIDDWHRSRRDSFSPSDRSSRGAYRQFLQEIGYLLPEPQEEDEQPSGAEMAAALPALALAEPVDSAAVPEDAPPEATASWRLTPRTARRYAAVSGDRNPIHMSALSAKPFGFPRAIAHGMYTAARALAAVGAARGPAFNWQVDFAKPVLLPSTVAVRVAPEDAAEDAERDAACIHDIDTPQDYRALTEQ